MLIEPDQQTGSGHIFQLPGERAPVQRSNGVGFSRGHHASDLFQVVVEDEAALEDNVGHAPSDGVRSSAKFFRSWEEIDQKS